jgi:hypothetical protein
MSQVPSLEVHTAHPPNLELEIARALVDASPVKFKWRAVNRLEELTKTVGLRSTLADEAARWHRLRDADIMPSIMVRPPVRTAPALLSTVFASGAGGEFAHANYYSEADTRSEYGLRRDKYRKSFFRSAGVVRPRSAEISRCIFDDTLVEATDAGIRGFAQLDYWYVFSRFRRWAGGNWGLSYAIALASPAFTWAAFRLSPYQRFSCHLHRELINRVAPFWNPVRFFYERKNEVPLREQSSGGGYPTIWQDGRLDDVISMMETHDELWETFDPALKKTYIESRSGLPLEQHTRYHNLAFRMAWRAGFSDHLAVVGSFCARSRAVEGV